MGRNNGETYELTGRRIPDAVPHSARVKYTLPASQPSNLSRDRYAGMPVSPQVLQSRFAEFQCGPQMSCPANINFRMTTPTLYIIRRAMREYSRGCLLNIVPSNPTPGFGRLASQRNHHPLRP